MTITVVGGGLAGLTASICCAESGAKVRLLEARSILGGRATSSEPPFIADFGAHALYRGGLEWAWLAERGLLQPVRRPPLTLDTRFRVGGRCTRIPPVGLAKLLLNRRRPAPVEESFSDWARELVGETTAAHLASAAGVFTFDHDPGRLSAHFVWERLVRVFRIPGVATYVIGGWAQLIARLETRARELGVEIVTGTRVDELPPAPVIVATELSAARSLLADDTLEWEGGHAVVIDLGLTSRRGDPAMVSDLDDGGFAERYDQDPSRAPEGHALVQSHIGIRPGESEDDAAARLESLLDAGFRDWRERVVWRRRLVMRNRTGALDLPGSTWQDRPAIDRGDGVYLAGDMVAAPGLLSEVAHASAVDAATMAVVHARARPRARPNVSTPGASWVSSAGLPTTPKPT